MRLIENEDDLRRLTDALCQRHRIFQSVIDQTGDLPLRRAQGGFAGLLKILVGQQVSVASASAIWAKVQTAELDELATFAQAPDTDILKLGFSRPKLRYARALVASDIDYGALADLSDQQVIGCLTKVTGIGPWTADIYLLTCLGRPDVFPAADLALQEAAKVLLDLPSRPDARNMAALAEPWSPLRSVAARALWAYYRIIKGKEGMT